MTEKRKKAIIRRRIFIALAALILAVTVSLITIIVVLVKNGSEKDAVSSDAPVVSSEPVSSDNTASQTSQNNSSQTSSTQSNTTSSQQSSSDTSSTNSNVELDPNFSRLLLVNGSHPLPDDYDTNVRAYLVEIDKKYRNNDNVTQIHRDVYPYITAMVAAAQADGVDLRVWSPFRSYATQNILFQNQVARMGGDETKAATVVARPGTSEHNTGLCADFNMAQDKFESTPMYSWMCEHAEDYGFILRYPKDKQSITGVIHESWHWRFVGINNAKKINSLGVTLEEFIEMNNIDPTTQMYGSDNTAN